MPLMQATGRMVTKRETMAPVGDYPNYGYSHFVTTILSLSTVRFIFFSKWKHYQTEFRLTQDHEESLYDWLVLEALNQAMRITSQAYVDQHYKHDVYKCVYDDIGPLIEPYIHQQFRIHKLQFFKGQSVKSLVAGDILIIVKGVIPSV